MTTAKDTKPKAEPKVIDNLSLWEQVREVPKNAQKPISGGRLKGMTDINPMFRIKTLTEQFGVCGIGWYYEITRQWTEEGGKGEKAAFVTIALYIKGDNEWLKPIVGTGGSSFIANEKNGLYTSDECVDGDCSVLTKKGWIKFKEYNGIDEIAQFNKDTDEISFVKPINFIEKYSEDTYVKGSVIMTGGHRNLLERVSNSAINKRFVDIAENISDYSTKVSSRPMVEHRGKAKAFRDIKSGFYGNPLSLTPLQKVGIMVACDGTKYRENKDGTIHWRLEFSKKRKIEKARELLFAAEIEILRDYSTKRSNGSTTTSLEFGLKDRINYKEYTAFLPLGNYPFLMDEISFWDGHCQKGKYKTFCTTNYKSATYLQTLFALSGKTVTFQTKLRPDPNHSTFYILYEKVNKTCMEEIREYGEGCLVYCVEVPTTFFLIKKNDDILVTGNCYKMALTDALSVSCKSLGVGADIYWSKDGESKYNKGAEPLETKATPRNTSAKTPERPTTTTTSPVITMEQAKRLYAMSKSDAVMCKEVMGTFGYTSAKDILRKDYDEICATVVEKVAEKEAFPEFNDEGLPF